MLKINKSNRCSFLNSGDALRSQMRQSTMKIELFFMYFNTNNASAITVPRRESFHISTLQERWSEKEYCFSTSCFPIFLTLAHCKTTQSFPVLTVSRPKAHLCPVPGSGRFPLMDIVGMLQLWSSSSPPRTLKTPGLRSWRTSDHIMSADLKNNKRGTTSGYHSAERPVAGSKEEHSQCWLLSNAIGICPSLKNNTEHGASQWHRPGKVLSSAMFHRRCKALLGNHYPEWMILLTRKQSAELQLWQTTWIEQLIVLSWEWQQT